MQKKGREKIHKHKISACQHFAVVKIVLCQ